MAKKASFAAASFAHLRAAAGEGAGEPLRIPLVDIDEDPKQPRRMFDQADLEVLAQTIREKGVLQPIGVLPPVGGRYVISFGARRFRASRMAGQADIPAVIVPEGQRDFATQVMENQQRADLSNSELADAVNQLHGEGRQGKDIAAICNLKDWQIAAYRAVEKMPDFLRSRLDNGDMRALYDLYRAWQKHPARVEDAMPEAGTFLTITEARRIVGALTGAATGSIILDQVQDPQATKPAAARPVSTSVFVPPLSPAERPNGRLHGQPPPEVGTSPEPSATPTDLHGANPAPAAGVLTATAKVPPEAQVEASAEAPPLPSEVGTEAPATTQEPPPSAPQPIAPRPATGTLRFVMETAEGVRGVLMTTDRPEAPGCVFLDVNGGWIEAPFAGLRGVETI